MSPEEDSTRPAAPLGLSAFDRGRYRITSLLRSAALAPASSATAKAVHSRKTAQGLGYHLSEQMHHVPHHRPEVGRNKERCNGEPSWTISARPPNMS